MDKRPHITVAGAINDDILARSDQPLNLRDSNPGKVIRRFGGVGLNIARNLMLLGSDVSFISAAGSGFREDLLPDDGAGRLSAERIVRLPDYPSATYVAVHGQDGDMAAAVSDMRIYDELDPVLLKPVLDVINKSDALVVDANLNGAVLAAIIENAAVPVIADPVSMTKAQRIRPHLPQLTLFKPNAEEAGAMLGMTISTKADASAAARRFLALGVRIVCVSLSRQGMILADGQNMFHVLGHPRLIENATGAGDSMLAMLAYSLCTGADLRTMGELAVAASLVTMEFTDAVNPALRTCLSSGIRSLITINPIEHTE